MFGRKKVARDLAADREDFREYLKEKAAELRPLVPPTFADGKPSNGAEAFDHVMVVASAAIDHDDHETIKFCYLLLVALAKPDECDTDTVSGVLGRTMELCRSFREVGAVELADRLSEGTLVLSKYWRENGLLEATATRSAKRRKS